MPCCVCAGASITCSFGAAPSVLNVLPGARVMSSQALASIMDNISVMNIMPFGMCHCCGFGSADAHALYAYDCRTLDARQPEAVNRRQTCPYQ